MTVSITRFSKNGADATVTSNFHAFPRLRGLAWGALRQWLLVGGWAWFSLFALTAQAIEVHEPRLEYGDGGWNLSVNFEFELPPALEDAVNKGIPLYFVTEFDLNRPRWYWFDEKPVSVRRSVRVAYHPLTRQYRVSTGGLQLPFVKLSDALSFVKRVRGWRVIDRQAVKAGIPYQAEVRIRLDVSQLPKPFQINAVNTSDWNLSSDWLRFPVTLPEISGAAMPPTLFLGGAHVSASGRTE
jgi:hypothetical protein